MQELDGHANIRITRGIRCLAVMTIVSELIAWNMTSSNGIAYGPVYVAIGQRCVV